VLWIKNLKRIVSKQPCVLVTMISISGSAPRESGARMVVAGDEVAGSIGGGNLEYQAIGMARELLNSSDDRSQHKKLVGLGPELNQCCGGAVALYYEVFSGPSPDWLDEVEQALRTEEITVLASALDGAESHKRCLSDPISKVNGVPDSVIDAARKWIAAESNLTGPNGVEIDTGEGAWWLECIRESSRPVMLFGAGHVGHAVADVLAPLPFSVTWVDSREEVFPEEVSEDTHAVHSLDPASWVGQARKNTIFIVMTHSHQLDEDICFEVLNRNDFAWLGLIGSETKRRRFVHRLEKRGIPSSRLDKLICPIGLAGIRGKQPATIALSLAAQLMVDHSDSE
jgi:xanthine dehydrogenase accessory factor